MSKGKNAIKIIAFFAIFLMVFWQVQEATTPVWDWPEDSERQRRAVEGIYAEFPDSLDVLWVGTSHMQYGVSPMCIYENTGIRSYNLATSGQSLSLSYERIKAALNQQSPQLVILDASALYFSENSNVEETSWEKVINSIPWSHISDKWNIAKAYATEKNLGINGIVENLIPLLRFHTNYANIWKKRDIELEDESLPYYRKGHVMIGRSVASGDYWGGTFEEMLQDYIARQEISENGIDDFSRFRINNSNNEKYLIKIKNMCIDNGCELVLTKIPVHTSYFYGSYWSNEKHEQIDELADRLDIKFIDLNDMDLIDWQTDSVDGGAHLNERGAMKVSNFWGKWLEDNYEFEEDIKNQWKEIWDKQLRVYNLENKYAILQTETDLSEYFMRVEQEDFTLFCAVSDTIGYQWGSELDELFQKLAGANVDMTEKGQWAYINISSNGVLIDETADSLTCNCQGKFSGGKSYSVLSTGWYAGGSASISIDEVEYASTGRGIRLVAYDNELQCVVDSVTFDTHSENLQANRDNFSYQKEFYEAIVNNANAIAMN